MNNDMTKTNEMHAQLKKLHAGMVDDINRFMDDARDSNLDYATTISNLMMLVAHFTSTFAVFHFEFPEDVFTDIMREHYKIALKGKSYAKKVNMH